MLDLFIGSNAAINNWLATGSRLRGGDDPEGMRVSWDSKI